MSLGTVEDFEGGLGDWSVNEGAISTSSPIEGSQSLVVDADSTTLPCLSRPLPSEFESQPDTFKFKETEISNDTTGGGLRLLDSNGNEIVGFATDNIGWYATFGGNTDSLSGSVNEGNIITVTITFDWSAGSATVEASGDGNTSSESVSLGSSNPIDEIQICDFNSGDGGWVDSSAQFPGIHNKFDMIECSVPVVAPSSPQNLTVSNP